MAHRLVDGDLVAVAAAGSSAGSDLSELGGGGAVEAGQLGAVDRGGLEGSGSELLVLDAPTGPTGISLTPGRSVPGGCAVGVGWWYHPV